MAASDPSNPTGLHATTVLGLIHNGEIALGADGQATMGEAVAKSNVRKIRRLGGKQAQSEILAGFAGGTADAFALIERFEEKLNQYGGVMRRAAIELAKDWRTDRYLRHLQALLIIMNHEEGLLLSGNGDVIEPENNILAIGSGGNYALAAAHALKQHAPQLSAPELVRASLNTAADICIYTNHNITIETL
jgi:ATP-dependent HslUV protease subunit HslV